MIDLDKIEEWNENDHGDEAYEVQAIVSKGDLLDIITRLRQAEKDAARYRWIKDNSQLGVGRCGVDWELHFDGPAPDNSAMIERHIDEAMQCK